MTPKELYRAPECYDVSAILKELICSSPVEGGLEGTTEEEWVY